MLNNVEDTSSDALMDERISFICSIDSIVGLPRKENGSSHRRCLIRSFVDSIGVANARTFQSSRDNAIQIWGYVGMVSC